MLSTLLLCVNEPLALSSLCDGSRSQRAGITQKTQHSCQRRQGGRQPGQVWHCTHGGPDRWNLWEGRPSLMNTDVCRSVLSCCLFCCTLYAHHNPFITLPSCAPPFIFLRFTASLCSYLIFFRLFFFFFPPLYSANEPSPLRIWTQDEPQQVRKQTNLLIRRIQAPPGVSSCYWRAAHEAADPRENVHQLQNHSESRMNVFMRVNQKSNVTDAFACKFNWVYPPVFCLCGELPDSLQTLSASHAWFISTYGAQDRGRSDAG